VTDTPTPQLYTLSLHDALPIWGQSRALVLPPSTSGAASGDRVNRRVRPWCASELNASLEIANGAQCKHRAAAESSEDAFNSDARSEEHTSELQSRGHLVCRLLL